MIKRWKERIPHIIRCIDPDEKGCRSWPYVKDKDGYPLQTIDNRSTRLTRYVLAQKLGRPLLPGMMALHTCDNPSCVEEEHLYEGTQSDNMRDRSRRGRTPNNLPPPKIGEAHHSVTLTREIVLDARERRARGESVVSIASSHGVKPRAVYRAIIGVTWRHV